MWNKRKWVNWMLPWLGYLWPLTFDLDLWAWIFEVKLYLRNGRPDCHGTKRQRVEMMPWCDILRKWGNWTLRWLGYLWPWPLTLNFQGKIASWEWEARLSWTKGTRVDRMPWCEIQRKWVNWTLRWLGYLWHWTLTLNFYGQILSWEWEARWSWNERDGSRYDALMWNTKEMSQLDAALTGVPLTLTLDLEFSRSNCILGVGGTIVMEQKGWESIGCSDVKHNHYVTLRQRILFGTGVTWDVGIWRFPSTGLVNLERTLSSSWRFRIKSVFDMFLWNPNFS